MLSVRSVSSLLSSVLVNIYKFLYVTGDLVSRKETVAGKFVNRGVESENIVRVMVFSAIFNNISVISWHSENMSLHDIQI